MYALFIFTSPAIIFSFSVVVQPSRILFFAFFRKLVDCERGQNDQQQQGDFDQDVGAETVHQSLELDDSVHQEDQKAEPADKEDARIPDFTFFQFHFSVLFFYLALSITSARSFSKTGRTWGIPSDSFSFTHFSCTSPWRTAVTKSDTSLCVSWRTVQPSLSRSRSICP